MSLSIYELKNTITGQVYYTPSEESIFEILKLDYITPEGRSM